MKNMIAIKSGYKSGRFRVSHDIFGVQIKALFFAQNTLLERVAMARSFDKELDDFFDVRFLHERLC